jgi:hypothetical protein
MKIAIGVVGWHTWWWLRGYLVCYEPHPNGTAFCKRRRRHPGRHATGNKRLRWQSRSEAPGPWSVEVSYVEEVKE